MHDDTEAATNTILVLGAGELGMAMLRGLAGHPAAPRGTEITVLLRPATIESEDPGKRREIEELRALGIHLLAGDLAAGSVAELARLFRPFGTVICCTGFVAGTGTQRKLAAAVLAAGVKRYVPWQFGVDYDTIGRGSGQDLWDEQLDVRDLLRSQDGTEWVIVSTGMFTSFLFEPSFGVVDLANGTIHALGGWDTAVTVTTPEDIGTLTAGILFAEPRIANRVVFTAGDTITYARLADILDSHLGRTLRRVEWDIPVLNADLAADPDNALKKYRVAFAQGTGVAWDIGETFSARNGIAVTDVAGWVRRTLE